MKSEFNIGHVNINATNIIMDEHGNYKLLLFGYHMLSTLYNEDI